MIRAAPKTIAKENPSETNAEPKEKTTLGGPTNCRNTTNPSVRNPERSFFFRFCVRLRRVLLRYRFWGCPDHGSDRGPLSGCLWLAAERSVREVVLAGLPHRIDRNLNTNWLDRRFRRVFLWRSCLARQGAAALGNAVGGLLYFGRSV